MFLITIIFISLYQRLCSDLMTIFVASRNPIDDKRMHSHSFWSVI